MKILINIHQQMLYLYDNHDILKQYEISSAKNGTGQLEGSFKTPLGKHSIVAKIGDTAPIYSVFVGRQATGEMYSDALAQQYPDRDWILTRILWLKGEEPGFNHGGESDSQARYIYIHGTPDTEPVGKPMSHGCIRMRNDDIIALYELVEVGTRVDIIQSEGAISNGSERMSKGTL